MAEEVKNATKVVPRAIQISVLLNGTLGLAMLIAYLFCLGNLDEVVEQSATLGYAYLYVFLKGTGSPGGAARQLPRQLLRQRRLHRAAREGVAIEWIPRACWRWPHR